MSSSYNRKDRYFNLAKDAGYRSRAAYKLLEIQNSYKLIKKGDSVLDLGSWPGGWLQVASESVGANGEVIGIDLLEIDPFEEDNITLLVGDLNSEIIIETILKISKKGTFNVVLSDMSPKLTGIRERDAHLTLTVAEIAWRIAKTCLLINGSLVIKLFKNSESEKFICSLKNNFKLVKRVGLDSTRKTSNEFYLICVGYR
jgi:23S rRNA (uridine2552-2'-O)-methyltransferase